jgi:hypothetical protein
MIRNFKIGADIEVFLRRKDTGEIVTAEGLILGTKEKPHIFDDSNPFYATSLDNVMAEFCIPPSDNPADFYFATQKALQYLNSIIPNDLQTVAVPAAYLDERFLQTENAKKFGCDPDFNAWTMEQNPPPGSSGNMRTGGGHIHVGYDDSNDFMNISIAKAMDIFVGVPSILQEPDNDRKALYGRAGSYRHKGYGVEYRTVSNYYLQSKELTEWVFNNTISAINFAATGQCNLLGPMEKEEIVNAINYNDKELANIVISKYGVKLL